MHTEAFRHVRRERLAERSALGDGVRIDVRRQRSEERRGGASVRRGRALQNDEPGSELRELTHGIGARELAEAIDRDRARRLRDGRGVLLGVRFLGVDRCVRGCRIR